MSKWTPYEEQVLRNEYARVSLKQLEKRFGRSAHSIQVKATRLGLKKGGVQGIVWTPQMLKILTDFFPIMFNKPLAKWLGVSPRTVTRKAAELGLKKVDDFFERKSKEIKRLQSEAIRKSNNSGRIQKGEHRSPATEFKKGVPLTLEMRAKQSASMKEVWKRRKACELEKKLKAQVID